MPTRAANPRRAGGSELGTTLLALLVVAATIAGIELRYRSVGGFPDLWPGWTQVELQWKVERAEPGRTVFFLGDSRVGWGLSEGAFDEALAEAGRPDLRAVNAALPAADLARIAHRVVELSPEPGVLLVNFSPGAFYVFTVGPGSLLADLKLQDFLDDRLRSWLASRLRTYGVGGRDIWRDVAPGAEPRSGQIRVASRTVFPDGFVNATFERRDRRPIDPAAYQLDSYRAWYAGAGEVPFAPELTARFPARRELVLGVLRAAIERGWQVVLVRLPVGPDMRALEQALPAAFGPERFAAELGVSYRDYQDDPRARELALLDQSHLAPDAARRMARILAADLAELLRARP